MAVDGVVGHDLDGREAADDAAPEQVLGVLADAVQRDGRVVVRIPYRVRPQRQDLLVLLVPDGLVDLGLRCALRPEAHVADVELVDRRLFLERELRLVEVGFLFLVGRLEGGAVRMPHGLQCHPVDEAGVRHLLQLVEGLAVLVRAEGVLQVRHCDAVDVEVLQLDDVADDREPLTARVPHHRQLANAGADLGRFLREISNQALPALAPVDLALQIRSGERGNLRGLLGRTPDALGNERRHGPLLEGVNDVRE